MPECTHHQELKITSWETNPVPNPDRFRPPPFVCDKDGIPPGLRKELLDPKLPEERLKELEVELGEEGMKAQLLAVNSYTEYLTATENAASLLHPTKPADLGPWSWACRIYPRTLPKEANNLRQGNQVPTDWGSATAYFVRDAHAKGSNSQWLLTSAHNVVHIFPWVVDKEGKITDTKPRPYVTVADAIMVAVGWGDETHIGWVDKIAVMSDYFSINIGNKDRYRFDGAALRIRGSTIPAKYWQPGPVLGTIIPPSVESHLEVEGSGILFCPGYPGQQNQYKDLAGLYIAGKNTKTFEYKSFEQIKLRLLASGGEFEHKAPSLDEKKEGDTSKEYNSCLVWDLLDCYSSEGQSGSACVLFDSGEAVIVGSLNGPGIGIPFAIKDPGIGPVAVDAIGLLSKVGVSQENLVLLRKNMIARVIKIG